MLQRQGRAHRLHTAAIADRTAPVYDYGIRSRVMTCDGHPGTVLAVAEGPFPGTESYEVQLDGGLGGGQYLPGQLQPLAAGHAPGTAAADYPELAQVLAEHPDPARGTLARAAVLQTTAMPSQRHPAPSGFHVREFFPSYDGDPSSEEEVPPGYDDHPTPCSGRDCGHFEERVLKGFDPSHGAHPNPVSELAYHLSSCGHQAKVDMLYSRPDAQHHGYASAMMDHLYARHPQAEIDHGERTPEGQDWWSSYTDPDPGRSTGGFSSIVAATMQTAGMQPTGDFQQDHANSRARNFHDRMRTFMNVNGGHRIPAAPATGREAHEAMASTCPDCGRTLHTDATTDTSGVTGPDGRPEPLQFDTPCDTSNPHRAPLGDTAHEPDDQPIEQSIGAPCTGCGTPMGSEQSHYGCQMCGRGDHHSYCCPTLHHGSHTAVSEMTLGETIVPDRIPGPGPTKAHSPMDNPASSGWASGPDPDQWSAAPLYPLDSRVGASQTDELQLEGPGAEATLHEEPTAALPSTDGEINADDTDPEALNPMGFNAVLQDFWSKAAHLDPRRSGGAARTDGDIAAAARAHLAGLDKTAAYAFTPGQRRELIEEAPEARAANADRLDLTGTHYADMQQMMGDDEEDAAWLL